MTSEQWRPIPEWEGFYEVSSTGLVRSVDRTVRKSNSDLSHYNGRNLKLVLNRRGRVSVTLSKPGRSPKPFKVHKLVAAAFLPKGEPGQEICHYNGDPADNRVENLRWDTHRANMQDFSRHCGTQHGASGYRRGCRCLLCREGHTERARAYRKGR